MLRFVLHTWNLAFLAIKALAPIIGPRCNIPGNIGPAVGCSGLLAF